MPAMSVPMYCLVNDIRLELSVETFENVEAHVLDLKQKYISIETEKSKENFLGIVRPFEFDWYYPNENQFDQSPHPCSV